ncbi:hypothetical protein PORY_001682 [Pneumocystis oryctolagi]|uniref:Uncharacterized protein n=1 Tax=Pneumocystis oryctolagi TaxID=42067 RepID=A0ACB7CEU1_9ASCO|nr:hypothetical protein PORY_001682 [Pneumocystis oryctolagi]
MDSIFLQNSNYIPTCIKDYCLLQQLGRGAFGDVFKAIPLKGKLKNMKMALKIINKTKLTSQTRRRRIINEIFIHSSLERHKNILDFYTSFEDNQNIYIVTQLCSHGSLYSFMQMQPYLPLQENIVKKIMWEIVSGLIFLHSHKIIHRDLKLSNILLDENDIAKIADFGLSTVLQNSSDEEPMTLCGTPNYISPEIIAHKPSGLASDIWSLGCIFFCLLDNSPPFHSENISKTLIQVINGNLRQLPSYISYEAKNLVNEMLQRNPSDRIKTHEILKHPFFTSISDSKKNYNLYSNYKSKDYALSSNFKEFETTTDISKFIGHISNLDTLGKKDFKEIEKKEKTFVVRKLQNIINNSVITSPEKKVLQRIENILNENKKNIIYKDIKKSNLYFPIKIPLLKNKQFSNLNLNSNNNIDYIAEKSFTTSFTQDDMNMRKNDKKFNILSHTIENNINVISEDWNINKEKKKNSIYNHFSKKYINLDEYLKSQPISYVSSLQKPMDDFNKNHNKSQSKTCFLLDASQETPIKYNSKNLKNLNILEKEPIAKSDQHELKQYLYINKKNDFSNKLVSDFAKKYHFNTKGLNTIKQKTKHANLEITKKGYLQLSFHNTDWKCLINPDGNKIKIIQNDKLLHIYELDDLPAKYLKAYRYASKFISILKSKIPKIILDTPYTKCRLYLNSVFEIYYINNRSLIVQLDSKKQTIKISQNNSENKNELLYEGDIDLACKKFPEIVLDAVDRYKKCLNVEKDTEDDIIDTYAKFIYGKGWWWINKKTGIMMFLDGSQLQVYFKTNNYLNTRSISHIKFIDNHIHEVYELDNNTTIPEIVKKKLLILKDYGLL